MKRKLKSLTRRQITKIIDDYEDRFEMVADALETVRFQKPDFEGALVLTITFASDKLQSYYMVSEFCMQEPYITFYHLVPVDEEPCGIGSFATKPTKQSTRSFIKKLGKEKRWNKIYEKHFIPNVERVQFVGHHTYSEYMNMNDVDAQFELPKSSVLDFKQIKKKKKLSEVVESPVDDSPEEI